jgi:hypothetical protein
MRYSARLLERIEQLTEYLINNTQTPPKEIEAYYEFCYNVLVNGRKLDESNNIGLMNVLLEEDFAKFHLALWDDLWTTKK